MHTFSDKLQFLLGNVYETREEAELHAWKWKEFFLLLNRLDHEDTEA